MHLRCLSCALLVGTAGTSLATPVVGKLELPAPPDRQAVQTRGFLDRVENPNKPVKSVDVAPYLLVVLEGDAKPSSSPQIAWDLVGDSFGRPVLGVPVGAEVVIKNFSHTARTLVAIEDPKLIPDGPVNPTGLKPFKVTAARVYTVGEKDTPHLRGVIVGVNTPFVTHVDVANNVGEFKLPDVPDGPYKLRIFYKDSWIAEETVNVQPKAKGKPAELTVKVATYTPKK